MRKIDSKLITRKEQIFLLEELKKYGKGGFYTISLCLYNNIKYYYIKNYLTLYRDVTIEDFIPLFTLKNAKKYGNLKIGFLKRIFLCKRNREFDNIMFINWIIDQLKWKT